MLHFILSFYRLATDAVTASIVFTKFVENSKPRAWGFLYVPEFFRKKGIPGVEIFREYLL